MKSCLNDMAGSGEKLPAIELARMLADLQRTAHGFLAQLAVLKKMMRVAETSPDNLCLTNQQRTKAIQNLVAARFNIAPSMMVSPRRHAAVARPRMLAMYLCHQFTDMTCRELGAQFGARDHGTVLHAIRANTDWISTDERWRMLANDLTAQIEKIFSESAKDGKRN